MAVVMLQEVHYILFLTVDDGCSRPHRSSLRASCNEDASSCSACRLRTNCSTCRRWFPAKNDDDDDGEVRRRAMLITSSDNDMRRRAMLITSSDNDNTKSSFDTVSLCRLC